jgi:hypothetical protein
MPKTCGQCIHTETAGETVVWCYGAPPAVLSATPAPNGGVEVKVQAPLVPVDRRACAVFRQKPRPRVGTGQRAAGRGKTD